MYTGEMKDKRIELLNKISKIKEVDDLIHIYNKQYYIHNESSISDEEYDFIKINLVKMYEEIDNELCLLLGEISEEDYNNLKAEIEKMKEYSSLKEIGSNELDDRFMKIKHNTPMKSLANIFTENDLILFIKKIQSNFGNLIEIVCEHKIDGISFSAIYKNGELQYLITRGDGESGEDITHNIKKINNFPIKIDITYELFEVRGEIYLSKEQFKFINLLRSSENKKLFSNSRNASSGLMRTLNSNEKNIVSYFIWDSPTLQFNKENYSDIKKEITNLGFRTIPDDKISNNSKEIISYCELVINNRESLPYNIDGVVLKVNNLSVRREIGETSQSPKWSIAYKLPAKIYKTKIKYISLSVNRNGVLVPIANIEPINIDGVVITKSTLHNFQDLKRKDIRENDYIFILRSGDVIPKIISVDLSMRDKSIMPYEPPQKCPSCNKNLIINDYGDLQCISGLNFCIAQKEQYLDHFANKYGFNIQGLGISQIQDLLKYKIINNEIDLFDLAYEDNVFTSNIQMDIFSFLDNGANHKINNKKTLKILEIDGWGEKSIINLKSAIIKSSNIELCSFIYALGIENVGREISKIIAKNYKTIDLFEKDAINDNISIPLIGDKTKKHLQKFFTDSEKIPILQKLKNLIKIENSQYISETDTEFVNKISNIYQKKIVITGTFEKFTREEIIKTIKSFGGIIKESISKTIDILVVAKNPSHNKISQAEKLKIEIINESEFLKELKTNKL